VPIEDAHNHIQDLQLLFPVITAKPQTLTSAITITKKHKFAFWDAMLWSTARENGVTILLSENFQNGRMLEEIKIINPFIEQQWN
jgi:predicted nucleic acid-binding protein